MSKRASTRQSIKNIHRYSPIPAIYQCLIEEIFDEIFSMACTDGGKTGHSLSTVLKRIHEVSKVFKYQTLWVKQTQLHPLAHVLHSLPIDAWRVVHLSILSSNLQQPLFGYRYDCFFDIDKNRVLALVAHSLHKLKVVAYHSQLLLPIPLPSLWDLTLRGGIKVENTQREGKHAIQLWSAFNSPNFTMRMNITFSLSSQIMLPLLEWLSCHVAYSTWLKIFLKSPLLSKSSSVPAIG